MCEDSVDIHIYAGVENIHCNESPAALSLQFSQQIFSNPFFRLVVHFSVALLCETWNWNQISVHCNNSSSVSVLMCSEVKSNTIQVIREVYEGDERERFEAELEKALEAKVNYIIIEPQRLGDETARWITIGNCLHKTAVVSGLASIVCGSLWPDRLVFNSPLCVVSIFCTGLYTISWNVDYCCQYQVSFGI